MAKKEEILRIICEDLYAKGFHSKPTAETFSKTGLSDEIHNIYRKLGGISETVPANIGKWDIDLESCIIELDEENHFNRYRLITLESKIYQNYNHFNVSKYKEYCKIHENECRVNGCFWSTNSSDRQFGPSNSNGDLSRGGSSRWKQRAFYDFMKDVYSSMTGIPLIRVSIYDDFNYSTVGQLLKGNETLRIRRFIKEKLDNTFPENETKS